MKNEVEQRARYVVKMKESKAKNLILIVIAIIFSLGMSVGAFIAFRAMSKQEGKHMQPTFVVDSNTVKLVEWDHASININETLIYRPVVEGKDTLRTIMTEKGYVLYVHRSWTASEIDTVITRTVGSQNWYGSK